MIRSGVMSHTVTVTRTTTSTTSAIILNTGYVKSIPGLLKLAEVILGGIVLGLLIYNGEYLCYCWTYQHYSQNVALFFLASISAFFITSLLLLISCLLSISTGPIIAKTNFEFIYHGAGFVLLLITSVLLLIDEHHRNMRDTYNFLVVSSILGLIMSALYLLSAIWGYRSYRGP